MTRPRLYHFGLDVTVADVFHVVRFDARSGRCLWFLAYGLVLLQDLAVLLGQLLCLDLELLHSSEVVEMLVSLQVPLLLHECSLPQREPPLELCVGQLLVVVITGPLWLVQIPGK